jgi:hypothetical protein
VAQPLFRQMPLIQIPDYAKLPDQLYDGIYTHADNSPVVHPIMRKAQDLYLFHDNTWCLNATHLLGLSRELIHSLRSNMKNSFIGRRLMPNWLNGHSFRLDESGKYGLSGTTQLFETGKLISLAEEACKLLEAADVTIDQWGGTSHDHWHEQIKRHVQAKMDAHPLIRDLGSQRSALEMHTLLANWANEVHHPEYGK